MSCGAPAISSEPLSPRQCPCVWFPLAAALGMVARSPLCSPCSLWCRAPGSCSGASRLAGVFIEQITPSRFCCKASASESKDLPSTSRMAPQLSVILSSPALPRDYHASCPVPTPSLFSVPLEQLSLSRRGKEVLHAPPVAIWHRGWCIAGFGGDPTRSTLHCSHCCNSQFWDADTEHVTFPASPWHHSSALCSPPCASPQP